MNIKLEKHTMTNSVFLHLFPGVVIILIYIMIVPLVTKNGFPNDTAMYITDIIGLVPVELGILLYVTKKKTGTYNIKTLFPYLEKAAVKEYVVFALIMAAWALLVSALMEPLELMIQDNIFSFVPTEYIMGSYDITTFSEDKLILTGLLGIIATDAYFSVIFNDTNEGDYNELIAHYKSTSTGTDEENMLLYDWGRLKVLFDKDSISVEAYIK